MRGSTLYLVGKFYETGELVPDATCCSMCKRQVINAGISKVVIRNTHDDYTIVDVNDWIENDESLDGKLGY